MQEYGKCTQIWEFSSDNLIWLIMWIWDCDDYFVVKRGNLLLIGCREQEVAHLGFEWILHFDIYIIAGCFFLIVWVHTVNHESPIKADQTQLPDIYMQTLMDRQTDLMTWFMTMGSGGSSRLVRRWGISENFSRGQSKICKSTFSLQWNRIAREMNFLTSSA